MRDPLRAADDGSRSRWRRQRPYRFGPAAFFDSPLHFGGQK